MKKSLINWLKWITPIITMIFFAWAFMSYFNKIASNYKIDVTNSNSKSITKHNRNKTTITLGYYSTPTSDKEMKALISRFTKLHPNIEVQTESETYQQYIQKIDIEIANGRVPDVWLADGVYVMKYAERGATKNLTQLINQDLKINDYYGFNFNKDVNGQYWGVPQGIQIGVLFYNKDLFDKANLPYPNKNWTWDDLKKAASQLTLDNKGRRADDPQFDPTSIKQFGFKFYNITEGWFPIIKAFGGNVLDKTMKHSLINSKQNVKAINWIIDGMNKHIFTTPLDIFKFQNDQSIFPTGSAAMRIGLFTRTLASNAAGINYDVTILPKGPTGKRFAPVIANSWVINKKSNEKKTQAAWKWIKYWVTDNYVQKEWADLGEAVPVKKSVANSPVFLKSGSMPKNKQAFLDSFKIAGTLDTNAVWEQWRNTFNDQLNQAFLGQKSVKQTLITSDKKVQKILDNFYINHKVNHSSYLNKKLHLVRMTHLLSK